MSHLRVLPPHWPASRIRDPAFLMNSTNRPTLSSTKMVLMFKTASSSCGIAGGIAGGIAAVAGGDGFAVAIGATVTGAADVSAGPSGFASEEIRQNAEARHLRAFLSLDCNPGKKGPPPSGSGQALECQGINPALVNG